MVSPEEYWILHGVDSFGHFQSREILAAKTFFLEQFEPSTIREVLNDKAIQLQLFEWYRDFTNQKRINAELCLRCFISHCLYQFCLNVEKKYRENYGLNKHELFPIILDLVKDIHYPQKTLNCSLSQKILDTFKIEKNSSLSTWTNIIVKGDKNYKKILKLYGIVEVTDWLILVKATPGNLERKLRQRGFSTYEIINYGQLLEAFHQVYSRELFAIREKINQQRIKFGQRKTNKPYPPPTIPQLQKIAELLAHNPTLESQEILIQLKKIAVFLRNNIIVNNFVKQPIEKPSIDNQLINLIQEQIESHLLTAIAQVIETRINYYLKQKRTRSHKAENFIRSLQLFHCQGYSMGQIASIINLNNQSQVSRLLKLKEFKEDVSRKIISLLKVKLTQQLSCFVSNPTELSILDSKIQEFLELEIQEIMNDATKEALDSKNHYRNSLFARTVCQYIEQRGDKKDERSNLSIDC